MTDRPTDGHDLHIYATSRRIKRCGFISKTKIDSVQK